MKRFWGLWALFLGLACPVWAHDVNISGLKFVCDAKSTVVGVSTHASKLEKLSGTSDLDAAIRGRLKIRLDGKNWTPTRGTVMLDKARDFVMWQTKIAQNPKKIEVLERLYPEDASSRLAVTVFRDGLVAQESLLAASQSANSASENQAQAASAGAVFGAYLKQGIEHIFGGPDHILFILGLLLMGGSAWQILKLVTAFTVAHSITLSLAATGVLAPSPRFVEPLIAFSIVCVALENFRHFRQKDEKKRDWRPFLAFGFGLLHGFGFAGALSEVGLPHQFLGWALAAFNMGVELGQATIVLVFSPLLVAMARSKPLHRVVLTWGSSGIALMGGFWFVQRVVGA